MRKSGRLVYPVVSHLLLIGLCMTIVGCERSSTQTPNTTWRDVPSRCNTNTQAWTGKTPLFQDSTARAGLARLNVDAMRLSAVDFDGDGYPDIVARRGGYYREDWSKPNQKRSVWLLRNKGDATFEDVTRRSKFLQPHDTKQTARRPVEVVAWGDLDNDGDLDAVTGHSSPKAEEQHLSVMLNHQGVFALSPQKIRPLSAQDKAPYRVGGLALTDVNRDGVLDLWVGRGMAQDRLYLGVGDGTFKEVTRGAGLETTSWASFANINQARAHTNAWSVAACDVDQNGVPDLLASSYGRAPNHLWLGSITSGKLTYRNRSIESGYAYDQRRDWRDNESARCHCTLNPDAAECKGVEKPRTLKCETPKDVFRWRHDRDRELFRLGGNSGTTVCADFNSDGKLDLLTTEIVHEDVGRNSDESELLYNVGEGVFARPGNHKTGLTRTRKPQRFWNDGDITAAALDVDNDGRQDIYIGSTSYDDTRGLLYRQTATGRFQHVPLKVGIDHRSSHGVAVADFDRDGDQDIIVGHARFRCSRGTHCYKKAHVRYFENISGTTQGNWVRLTLEGQKGSNASAIGAHVTMTLKTASNTTRRVVHEVNGGHGHYGIQHELPVHLGVGDACQVQVRVRWPDAALNTQVFTLPVGYSWHLKQGGVPRVLSTPQQ